MGAQVVDVSSGFGPHPVGPLRDKETVDISAADHVDEGGFVCQAVGAGALTYRTLGGAADQEETVAAGGTINVGGVMVLLKAVRANAAVGSIVVGKL